MHIYQIIRIFLGSVLSKAEEYLKSLWASRLTNLEKMTETGIPENYHNPQHFISEPPWDGFQLMDTLTKEVQRPLPQKNNRVTHRRE